MLDTHNNQTQNMLDFFFKLRSFVHFVLTLVLCNISTFSPKTTDEMQFYGNLKHSRTVKIKHTQHMHFLTLR